MPLKLSNIPRNLASIIGRLKKATLYIGATIEMKLANSNRVALSENQFDCFGNPIAHLHFNFSEEDLASLQRCREYILSFYEKIGATDIFEAPVSWSRHHQGTCRMGDNPETSVVDRNLRVHEAANLYVCGSEVFVTGGAMQPCLTIVALAHRLADHLAESLRG
jgi:choline dehydrogenase-like flavoprotein